VAIPIYQVDAFTPVPFKGNPAGVCLLDGPAEEQWMQSVAAEMNLGVRMQAKKAQYQSQVSNGLL